MLFYFSEQVEGKGKEHRVIPGVADHEQSSFRLVSVVVVNIHVYTSFPQICVPLVAAIAEVKGETNVSLILHGNFSLLFARAEVLLRPCLNAMDTTHRFPL